MRKILLSFVAVLFSFAVFAQGIENPRTQITQSGLIYVAKNGNNAATGSIGDPYLSVGAANTVAAPGTTIIIAPGTYTENLTLKAGVSLQGQQARTAIIVGNMTANYSGTTYLHSVDLQASSGAVLTISGANSTNLQTEDIHIDALNGSTGAVSYTNTNAASKFTVDNAAINVFNSTGGATVFTSPAGSAGTVIWEDVSARILDNLNNTSLSIGGAVAFTHTMDDVHGPIVVANTATYVGTLNTYQTTSVAVLSTTSSGVSALGSSIIQTSASPTVTGVGGFAFGSLAYSSTGVGFAATLNGGAGAITFPVSPINVIGAIAVNSTLGLSVTKTVRAAGGAADCTLIYTGGILTGGTC